MTNWFVANELSWMPITYMSTLSMSRAGPIVVRHEVD